MLFRYINQFKHFPIVHIRSLTNTSDSQITIDSVKNNINQQSAIKLSQEYGRRMKAHLARAETEQVLSLLDELIQKHDIKPNYVNYLLAMKAINHSKQRTEAERLHNLIKQNPSIINEVQIQTGLVYMYAVAIGDIPYAEKLAAAIQVPHISLLTALMTGYIRNNMAVKAIELYDKIESDGQLTHNAFSYNAMINACAKLRYFTRGKEIINKILAENDPLVVQNTLLINSMIDMLGKAGNNIDLCIQLFNSIKIKQRTSYLYSAMMKAYNKSDKPRETLKMFDQIVNEDGHTHDPIHFILVFNACAKFGRVCLKKAHTFYQMMLKELPKCERHPRCRNAAIDMFAKCADVQTARQIFESNQDLNDIVSWGSILNTYAIHADGYQVLDMFERMQNETNIKPNAQIYSTVLNACSHSGLLDNAKEIFSRYNIQLPDLWKYVIMIDALARADQLDEALVLIDKYELTNSPSMTMYMSILSCARNRGLVQLAEKIIKRLENSRAFRLEELKTAYVLMANLYNAQGYRKEAFMIRQMMREKKMTKVPGLTWVDINGVTHEFHANDRRHAQMREIYEEITRIDDELKQDGHIIDINSVPVGSVHSEKLAIALALISTEPGSPIVLTKNLRVCPDCHEMTKRLSRVRKREIVIRDSFRYHIFNDGQCSCGDFL